MDITIITYLSILYFLSEFILMLSKRSKDRRDKIKTQSDKHSLLILWITISLTITAAFFNADWKTWSLVNVIIAYAGVSILFVGVFIRWISITQLNEEFTVDVSIRKDHILKTDGLYKIVRHPSYFGLYLICVGLAIGMNSWTSFLIISIPLFAALSYRIKIEENALTKEFGEDYSNYKKRTSKLLPKIY